MEPLFPELAASFHFAQKKIHDVRRCLPLTTVRRLVVIPGVVVSPALIVLEIVYFFVKRYFFGEDSK